MNENFLNQIRNEAVEFHRRLDSEIGMLLAEGLMTEIEQERLRVIAVRYREALEESLRTPMVDVIQEPLILSLVRDYEGMIDEEVLKVRLRRYTDDKVKQQIDSLIQSYCSQGNLNSLQVEEDALKELKRDVQQLEATIWKNLKNEIRKRGNKSRPEIVERTLKALEDELKSIGNKYTRSRHKKSSLPIECASSIEEGSLTPQGVTWILTRQVEGQVKRYFSPNGKGRNSTNSRNSMNTT
jgi:hypothetical protein